ncbi:MAG: endonuclease III [Clostridiales bacterium]|nr:endonuclease III [Clostridiales bacterium]
MRVTLKQKRESALEAYNVLNKTYPDACCSLDLDDPYFFLVRAILSAQCTDVRVNKTVEELEKKVKTPDDVLKLGESELSEIIKPCGLYKAKAKNIIGTTEIFINDWGREIPKDINMLVKAPGIGRKIGNLLLGELYSIPALVVDTHFKRVAGRLGLTESDDPTKVEADVCKVTDPSMWIRMGHLFVAFGRDICEARNPKCDICPLNKTCKGAKKNGK